VVVREPARFATNHVARGYGPVFSGGFRGENAVVVSVHWCGLDGPPTGRTFVEQRDVDDHSAPETQKSNPAQRFPTLQRGTSRARSCTQFLPKLRPEERAVPMWKTQDAQGRHERDGRGDIPRLRRPKRFRRSESGRKSRPAPLGMTLGGVGR